MATALCFLLKQSPSPRPEATTWVEIKNAMGTEAHNRSLHRHKNGQVQWSNGEWNCHNHHIELRVIKSCHLSHLDIRVGTSHRKADNMLMARKGYDKQRQLAPGPSESIRGHPNADEYLAEVKALWSKSGYWHILTPCQSGLPKEIGPALSRLVRIEANLQLEMTSMVWGIFIH